MSTFKVGDKVQFIRDEIRLVGTVVKDLGDGYYHVLWPHGVAPVATPGSLLAKVAK